MAESNTIRTKIAGIAYNNRDVVAHKLHEGDSLILRREPENPHDRNAIAVYTLLSEQVGYLPKELAADLAADLAACENLFKTVVIGKDAYEKNGVLVPSITCELQYVGPCLTSLMLSDKFGRFYIIGLRSGKVHVKYESGKERLYEIYYTITLLDKWRSTPVIHLDELYDCYDNSAFKSNNKELTPFEIYDVLKRDHHTILNVHAHSRIRELSILRKDLLRLKRKLAEKNQIMPFTYLEDIRPPVFPHDLLAFPKELEKQKGKGAIIGCVLSAILFLVPFVSVEVIGNGDMHGMGLWLILACIALPFIVPKIISSNFMNSNNRFIKKAKYAVEQYEIAEQAYADYLKKKAKNYAEWCRACAEMDSVIRKAAKDYQEGLKSYLDARTAHPWAARAERVWPLIEERYRYIDQSLEPNGVITTNFRRPVEVDCAITFFKSLG